MFIDFVAYLPPCLLIIMGHLPYILPNLDNEGGGGLHWRYAISGAVDRDASD
jgi:hypothetical protein